MAKVTVNVPAWFDKNYPDWKKNLWGILRAFVAAFLATMGLMLTSVTVDNFQSKETIIKLLASIFVASLAAGIVGIGKFLRDLFPDSKVLQKLPL